MGEVGRRGENSESRELPRDTSGSERNAVPGPGVAAPGRVGGQGSGVELCSAGLITPGL